MAYTTINKSTDYFNTKLHSGTDSTTTITGVGFQPDMTWWKSRNNAVNHALYDAVRGGSKLIRPNQTNAEETNAAVSAFTSDGVTLTGGDSFTNASGYTYASWNWKAGTGQGSSNTDGSINTIYTSVNTAAGFSISRFDGNGTSGATIGHGLGSTPAMIIVKNLDSTEHWTVRHKDVTAGWNLYLNLTNTQDDNSTVFTTTAPTSSVFSVGDNARTNASGAAYIAYCFAEKTGYSKIGQYTGNNSADGTFVYTGFKPSFILIKNVNATQSWRLIDNKRIGYNPNNIQLYPNLTNAESTSEYVVDILSNGFKVRATDSGVNGSGNTMIYLAIGQSLVGSNNVPCTAR